MGLLTFIQIVIRILASQFEAKKQTSAAVCHSSNLFTSINRNETPSLRNSEHFEFRL